MLAGLLHDIGYWVLAQECSAELRASVELAAATGIPMHEAEAQVVGASHAEIGAVPYRPSRLSPSASRAKGDDLRIPGAYLSACCG